MSITARIDAEIERLSLLKHPFYKMWSNGELTLRNLAGYSMEYFQLVKAVPELVSNVAVLAPPRKVAGINENLAEELTHVEPWIGFAGSLGVKRDRLLKYRGARATNGAVGQLKSLTTSSFEEGAAAMYAYEKQIPMISRSKIEGLKKHYGMKDGDATRYFELHEEADVRHAAVWRSFLARNVADEDKAFDAARGSLDAQNALLDSVMANHC